MEANQKKSKKKEGWVLVGRGHPALNRRELCYGSPLLTEMNGSEGGWVLFPGRTGGEDHKRRLPSW